MRVPLTFYLSGQIKYLYFLGSPENNSLQYSIGWGMIFGSLGNIAGAAITNATPTIVVKVPTNPNISVLLQPTTAIIPNPNAVNYGTAAGAVVSGHASFIPDKKSE